MDLNFKNIDLDTGMFAFRHIMISHCAVWLHLKTEKADPFHFFSRKSRTTIESGIF